jgi:hypothetical protein
VWRAANPWGYFNMDPFNWECPHCGRPQVVTGENSTNPGNNLSVPKTELGDLSYQVLAIACLNEDCKKLTLIFGLNKRHWTNGGWQAGDIVQQWRLIPDMSAKPQPAYIPRQLIEDYTQACRIRDLSPKASATLARRCLQGMIRNFCKITKKTLDQEIKALRVAIDDGTAPRGVTPESVDGIDDVRKVGNIGAHMESDVNMIIDIEPGEAQMLIELIETLFDEWYVAQYKREQRFAGVKALAEAKKEEIAQLKIAAEETKALPAPEKTDK